LSFDPFLPITIALAGNLSGLPVRGEFEAFGQQAEEHRRNIVVFDRWVVFRRNVRSPANPGRTADIACYPEYRKPC